MKYTNMKHKSCGWVCSAVTDDIDATVATDTHRR